MSQPKSEMQRKINDDGNHKNEKENEVTKSNVNSEYFQALEQWLNDARSYKYYPNIFALPYGIISQHMYGLSLPNANTLGFPIASNESFGVFSFPRIRQPERQHQQQPQIEPEDGVEYTIPPFWKRFIAEVLDSLLLFIMKLAITFIAVDFFEFADLVKYESLQQQGKMDYKIAIEIASEILLLEIIYKLIVCLYEGIFLRKGMPNQIGGATPGKIFMGIRVVLCESVQQVANQPNLVKIIPATDLGFGWSFARALLKNLVLALLFPICFPFFINKFNRTTYDILCYSIVVEDRAQVNRNR